MHTLARRMGFGLGVLLLLLGLLADRCLRAAGPLGHSHAAALFLAIATLVVGSAVAVALFITTMASVRHLSREVRRTSQGDLEHRIAWSSNDELGSIATDVNRMAIRLFELRETEAGRRQMEFQLSDAVLHSIFEPVIVTDSKGHVLRLNQAASNLLNKATDDRMALSQTKGGEKILETIRRTVSLQKAITAEDEQSLLTMSLADGERTYRLRATPMRDAENRVLGVVTTLEDVTTLRDVDRFKTNFLGVASRKLRDPLRRLRLSLHSISRGYAGTLRPLQEELIWTAEEQALALDDLIADLIEVSELDSGNRELLTGELEPFAVLTLACTMHEHEAESRNISLTVKAAADLPRVAADPRALRTILDNLLTNAIRYTKAGGRIVLSAKVEEDKVAFAVQDSGSGIAPERLSHIFERFNADSESRTGLGLALVQRLVEHMGGQINVESAVGQGTVFHFTLPLATAGKRRHGVEIG